MTDKRKHPFPNRKWQSHSLEDFCAFQPSRISKPKSAKS